MMFDHGEAAIAISQTTFDHGFPVKQVLESTATSLPPMSHRPLFVEEFGEPTNRAVLWSVCEVANLLHFAERL